MCAMRVANAPCSWGVLEFDLEGAATGFGQVLDEMAQAGYAGTELGDWGFMPTDPAALGSELQQRNLEMLAALEITSVTRMTMISAEPRASETRARRRRNGGNIARRRNEESGFDGCSDTLDLTVSGHEEPRGTGPWRRSRR